MQSQRHKIHNVPPKHRKIAPSASSITIRKNITQYQQHKHKKNQISPPKRYFSTPAGDNFVGEKVHKPHKVNISETSSIPYLSNLLPSSSNDSNMSLLGDKQGGLSSASFAASAASPIISSSAFASLNIVKPDNIGPSLSESQPHKLPAPALFNIDSALWQFIDDKSWLTSRRKDDSLPKGLSVPMVDKIREFQNKLPAPVHSDTASILALPRDLGGFGFEQLTFIQGKLLPMIASGLDILLRAPTSSGKTLAYAIPLIERLLYSRFPADSQKIPIIVLVPTRELALQTSATLKHLLSLHQRAADRQYGVMSLVGGSSSLRVEQEPLQNTHIGFLVATTQRLNAHIQTTPGFKERLSGCRMVVLDEVDYLLGQTGGADIGTILSHCHKQRQTIMLSATLTPSVRKVASFALRKGACIVDVVKDSIVSLGTGLASGLSNSASAKNDSHSDTTTQETTTTTTKSTSLQTMQSDDVDLMQKHISRQQDLVGKFVNAQGETVDIDHSEIVDKLGTGKLVMPRKTEQISVDDDQRLDLPTEQSSPVKDEATHTIVTAGGIIMKARKQLPPSYESIPVGDVDKELQLNEDIVDDLVAYSEDDENPLVLFDEVNKNVQHFVQSCSTAESLFTVTRLLDDIGGRFLYAKQQVDEYNLRLRNDPNTQGQDLLPPKPPKVMIFCETARYAQFLAFTLRQILDLHTDNAFEAIFELHSKRKQNYRTRAAQAFATETFSAGTIMLCSDVASRGLDTADVDLVIQLGMPSSRQQYVQRVGRAARDAEQTGSSLTLLPPSHVDRFAQMMNGLPISAPRVNQLGLGVPADVFVNTPIDPMTGKLRPLGYSKSVPDGFAQLGDFLNSDGEIVDEEHIGGSAGDNDDGDGSAERFHALRRAFEKFEQDSNQDDDEDDAHDLSKNHQDTSPAHTSKDISDDDSLDQQSEQEEQSLWHQTIERACAGIYLERITDESERIERHRALNAMTMSSNTGQINTELYARFDFGLRKRLGGLHRHEEHLLNAERAYISILGHHMLLYAQSKQRRGPITMQSKLKAVKEYISPFSSQEEVAKFAYEFAQGIGLCGPRNDLPPPAIAPSIAKKLGFSEKFTSPYLRIGRPTEFSHIRELHEREADEAVQKAQRNAHRLRREFYDQKHAAIKAGLPVPPTPGPEILHFNPAVFRQKYLDECQQKADIEFGEESPEQKQTSGRIVFPSKPSQRRPQHFQQHTTTHRIGGAKANPNQQLLIGFDDENSLAVNPQQASKHAANHLPQKQGTTASFPTTDDSIIAGHDERFAAQHAQFAKQQEFGKYQKVKAHFDKKDSKRAQREERAQSFYHKDQPRNKKDPMPGRELLSKTALYQREPRRLRTGELDHKVHQDINL